MYRSPAHPPARAQNAFTARILQTQSALDLYLMEMRRIDDRNGMVHSWRSDSPLPKAPTKCRAGKCRHYPTLRIEMRSQHVEIDEGAKQAAKAKAAKRKKSKRQSKIKKKANRGSGMTRSKNNAELVLTLDQLKAHLVRPGAQTDHFDHPYIYARSGLKMLCLDYENRITVDYDQEMKEDFYSDDYEFSDPWGLGGGSDSSDLDSYDSDESVLISDSVMSLSSSDGSSECSSFTKRSELPTSSESDSSFSSCDFLTPRVGGQSMFKLSHLILKATTKLVNLGITGSFEKLFRKPSPLSGLRYLSVGPLSRHEAAGLCVQDVQLPSLERLRLCGDCIGRGTACNVAGVHNRNHESDIWPRLKEFQWDFGRARCFDGDPGHDL